MPAASACIVHLSNMTKQNCIWRTHAAQGRQQLGWHCGEHSQSPSAMYGSSRGYYGYSMGSAGWAILVRLAGSSSWPTLNSPADWAEWAAWMIAWDLSIYHSLHLAPWRGGGRQGKAHNTHMKLCDGALHTINSLHTYITYNTLSSLQLLENEQPHISRCLWHVPEDCRDPLVLFNTSLAQRSAL